MKGPETERFVQHIENAEKELDDANLDAARSLYMAALSINSIPMDDAAEAFDGVAKTLKKDEKLETAELLASISAELHPAEPKFVNTYAEILIELCEISLARDKLRRLGLSKDNRSNELMKAAENKESQCNSR